VAHIRVDPLIFERRHTHVAEGGVDGLGQIQFGIDQGAVEIENQKVHFYAAPVFGFRGRPSRAMGLRRARTRRSPRPVLHHFPLQGIAMDAEQLAGRRLIAPAAIEGALDHASFQHLDGLMQRDVSSEKMLHQPVEFFLHFL